jgi:glycosyltransferase involved in cell wall biosynthesis
VPAAGTATGTFVEWAPGAAATAPPADPGALAAAIRSLLDDDERRLRLAELAQRRVIAEDADWTASSLVRLAGEIASE